MILLVIILLSSLSPFAFSIDNDVIIIGIGITITIIIIMHRGPTIIIITIIYFYTGSLGLNLLDPVSCRGLFALFALSFDIVSPEASRHRRLTFAREARTHAAYLYCNLLRGSLDDPTDDPPGCARRPCV